MTGGFIRGRTSNGRLFNVTTDVTLLERNIRYQLGDDLPFVLAKSLTQSAKSAQGIIARGIVDKYDRPTRFTRNATFIEPATKRKLEAAVFFKDEAPKGVPAGRYLRPTVRGGPRAHKGFERRLIAAGHMKRSEYAVPGKGVWLNSFGNVSNGMVQKILSSLGAQRDGAQNSTARSRARAEGAAKKCFVAPRGSHLPRGIWERRVVRGRSKVRPVFIFVDAAPRYDKLLPFERMAATAVRRPFKIHFARNAKLVLSRPRRT